MHLFSISKRANDRAWFRLDVGLLPMRQKITPEVRNDRHQVCLHRNQDSFRHLAEVCLVEWVGNLHFNVGGFDLCVIAPPAYTVVGKKPLLVGVVHQCYTLTRDIQDVSMQL